MSSQELLSKIEKNEAIVGIIGLGYVGLPLAVSFAKNGIKVLGVEKNEKKVSSVNEGQNYIQDVDDEVLKSCVREGKLSATSDASRIHECDALIICVPTPLDHFKKPDMSFVESACIDIGRNMKKGVFIKWRIPMV